MPSAAPVASVASATAAELDASFTAAWQRSRDDLLRYAYRYVGQREQAEDCVDDALATCWKLWGTSGIYLRPGWGQRNYLFRAVYNQCMTLLRRRKCAPDQALSLQAPPQGIAAALGAAGSDSEAVTLADVLADTMADGHSVEDVVAAREAWQYVLTVCTPRQRAVLILNAQGYAWEEIVEKLAGITFMGVGSGHRLYCTVGAVKKDLYNLRNHLAQHRHLFADAGAALGALDAVLAQAS